MSRSPALPFVPALVVVLLLGGLSAGPAAAGSHGAAATKGAAQPAPAPRMARLPQGARVELAPSALSQAELAALRPGIERLKPKVRGNSGD